MKLHSDNLLGRGWSLVMLCPDSQAIVDRDRGISGLGTLLDGEALALAVNQAVPGLGVRKAELNYLRYKPGQNCVAQYQLHTLTEIVDVYAKAHGSDAREKLAKAVVRQTLGATFETGRLFLDTTGIEISAYPDDAKLVTLQKLGNSDDRFRLLRRLLPTRENLWHAQLFRLAYKPERRLVMLARGHGEAAVLKFYTRTGFDRAKLAAQLRLGGNGWQIPNLIGDSRSKAILAFEFAPGECLRKRVSETSDNLPLARQVGLALAEFHSVPAPANLPVLTGDDRIAELSSALQQLSWVAPELEIRANQVAGTLTGWLRVQKPAFHLVHGDYYDKQILVGQNELTILDLDRAHIGDPRIDISTFIAHLIRDVCSGRLDEQHAAAFSRQLIHGYRGVTGSAACAELNYMIALALMHLIHHPFRYAERNWTNGMSRMLTYAEALIHHRSPWLEE